MSFFINDAFAANAAASQGDNIYSFVMVAMIFCFILFHVDSPTKSKGKSPAHTD